MRQIKLQPSANHTPLMLEFGCAFRSQQLYDDLVYVRIRLTNDDEPSTGISGPPGPARLAVLNIAHYHQALRSRVRPGV